MQIPQIVEIRQHGTVVAVAALTEDEGRIRAVDATGRPYAIPAARIVCETGLVPTSAEADAAAAEVAQYEKRQQSAGRAIDVRALWERASAAGSTTTLRQLAALVVPDPGGEEVAAVLRAIVADGLRFRVLASEVEVLAAEQVEAAKRARQEARRRAEVRQATVLWLRGEVPDAPLGSEEFVDALRVYAAQPDQPPARDPSAVLMRDAGLQNTPATAFETLVRLGVFQPDENLLLIRHGFATGFPDVVLETAESAARSGPSPATRRDLRDWPTVSIDEQATTEVDDALSVESLPGGGARVGIHLADPGAFFDLESAVDREGRARQTTLYLPDRKRLMLPAVLSERAASLGPGRARPAFSVVVELDADGCQTGVEITRSQIRVDRAVTYDQADREIERGGDLALLADLADASRRRRIAAGAVETDAATATPVVGEDGRVELVRSSDDSRSRKLVAEFMVRANRVVARYCRRHDVPAPFRRQELRKPIPEGLDLTDRYAVFQATRCLGKAWADVRPGRHHGLAVDEYVQVTSPLRRYLDLVTQRQVIAHREGVAPPLDASAILALVREAQPILSRARLVSAGSRDYWMLRWLEGRVGGVLEAVVLKTQRRRVRVELVGTTHRLAWRPPRPVREGERLQVRVDAVDPRAGRLGLTLVD